jgi:hypothetical protein
LYIHPKSTVPSKSCEIGPSHAPKVTPTGLKFSLNGYDFKKAFERNSFLYLLANILRHPADCDLLPVSTLTFLIGCQHARYSVDPMFFNRKITFFCLH